MDLAYYCSNQSVEIAIRPRYKVDEGQVSDIGSHASKLACANRGVHSLKQCQYFGIVLWYGMVRSSVERSQFDCLLERNFFKF